MIYHSKVETKAKTRFVAIKKATDLLIEKFKSKQNTFVKCIVCWDTGRYEFIARREVMNKLIGIDYENISEYMIKELLPADKKEYIEFFETLFRHSLNENIQDKN